MIPSEYIVVTCFGGIFMSDKKRLAKNVLIGVIAGTLFCALLLCLLAVILSKGGLLEQQAIDWIMAAVTAAGAFAGGFTASKLNKGAGLIAGAATGAAMLVALATAAALLGKADITALFPVKLAGTLLGGAAGGILAVKEKKRI